MKTKRVECDECKNFIKPKLTVNGMIKSNAKCKLGKRVMFRMPIFSRPANYNSINNYGYIRYCNEFKAKE